MVEMVLGEIVQRMAVESARVEVEAHYQRIVIRRDVDAAPVENHPVEFESVAELEDRLILEQRLQLGAGGRGVDLRRAIRKQVVPAMMQRAVEGAAAIRRHTGTTEVGGDDVTDAQPGVPGRKALT